MKQPIPVTVVSGFLGSGKTTLLCDLLQHRQEMRLAVLINEVGEVSIDGALARASAGGKGGVAGGADGRDADGVSSALTSASTGGTSGVAGERDTGSMGGQGGTGRTGDAGRAGGVADGRDAGGTSGSGGTAGAGEMGRAGRSQEVDIVDFPSGLIAYAEDTRFVPTLQAIAQRPGRVDHVLIETSGVALPSAAMERLQSPELANDFVLDATLVVVDTPRLLAGEFSGMGAIDAVRAPGAMGAVGSLGAGGAEGPRGVVGAIGAARAGDTVGAVSESESAGSIAAARVLFDQQLAGADVVVLNKIDQLDADALLAAEEQIRQRAPNVRFLELAHNAQLDVRLALGLRLHQATARPPHFHGPFTAMPGRDTEALADHGRVDGHTHSGLVAHSHGLTTHTHFHEQDPGWLSFTLRSDEQHDVTCLRDALEDVARSEQLLRCKGFVLSAEAGRHVLFQGVRTRVMLSDAAAALCPKGSELVFIGYHLNRARVVATLNRLTGKAWS